MAKTIAEIKKELEQQKGRSAWRRGVINYASELIDNIEQNINYLGLNDDTTLSPAELKKAMLNGAENWKQYSWGGCSLIYDHQIAAALCTPSEFKRTDGGRLRPNNREQWLDTQSRALSQAAELIYQIAYNEGVICL